MQKGVLALISTLKRIENFRYFALSKNCVQICMMMMMIEVNSWIEFSLSECICVCLCCWCY